MKHFSFLAAAVAITSMITRPFRGKGSGPKIETPTADYHRPDAPEMIAQRRRHESGTTGTTWEMNRMDYNARPSAHGIPTPPPRNQRQRRKAYRQLMANGLA